MTTVIRSSAKDPGVVLRSGTCDPAYPDVCLPLAPPDLDCDEIPYRNFGADSADPHGLDRDHDHIACEAKR